MESKLLPYQIEHVENLVNIIQNKDRAIDLSDTGTGKTYTSIAICRILNLIPFIVCPKSVISSWEDILKHFEYENNTYELTTYNKVCNLEINYSINYLFIYDEVHKCKNQNTINAKNLMEISDRPNTKILMLSATAVDKINNFIVYGYVLKLYPSLIAGNSWIINRGSNAILKIRRILFPNYASRMSIDDIQNIFKDNKINMEGIQMENYNLIEEQYDEIQQLLKSQEKQLKHIGKIQKLRQDIEFLKINTFAKMTNDYLQLDKSVVIFVNFTNTLLELAKLLKTKCIIYGQQTIEERAINIKDFCSDRSRVIICNIQSGGCGISLHDINGKYQRVSLISPTWSAQDLIQVLGRIHRAMAKTDAIQRIIFCKNTIEEEIGRILNTKINNIKMLNNGNSLGKNDYMKNIIQTQIKLNNNINLNLDNEQIYDLLKKLYSDRDTYEKELLHDTQHKLNKTIKMIKMYEDILNKDLI